MRVQRVSILFIKLYKAKNTLDKFRHLLRIKTQQAGREGNFFTLIISIGVKSTSNIIFKSEIKQFSLKSGLESPSDVTQLYESERVLFKGQVSVCSPWGELLSLRASGKCINSQLPGSYHSECQIGTYPILALENAIWSKWVKFYCWEVKFHGGRPTSG